MKNNDVTDRILTAEEYESLRNYLEKACGIELGENEHYLVANRLDHLLQELSLESVKDLIDKLNNESDDIMQSRFIDAMTTNETSWFRDGYPFEVLKQVILPEAVKKKTREIRIWSAACSSGQEPYSISIAIQEFLREHPGSLTFSQVIATEISSSMLQSAREGNYNRISLSRGLSQERRDKYFNYNNDQWRIKPEIRERVVFKELNLMDSFILLGRFDVVFCRNVLIYFSETARADILHRIIRILQPGGYLFLGGSESPVGFADELDVLNPGGGLVYKLKNHGGHP